MLLVLRTGAMAAARLRLASALLRAVSWASWRALRTSRAVNWGEIGTSKDPVQEFSHCCYQIIEYISLVGAVWVWAAEVWLFADLWFQPPILQSIGKWNLQSLHPPAHLNAWAFPACWVKHLNEAQFQSDFLPHQSCSSKKRGHYMMRNFGNSSSWSVATPLLNFFHKLKKIIKQFISW